MKGSLIVTVGGLFTTIQDRGRFGYRKFGVPVSGAMDKEAYKWANRLLGQSENTPVIEMTQKGGEFLFNTDAVISITGADMSPRINGDLISTNKVHYITEGDYLEFDSPEKGYRTYIGILGEWSLKKVMSSFSTYTLGEFGGLHGELLDVGDKISWEERKPENVLEEIPKECIPYYSSKLTVEFIAGPEWDWLTKEEQEKFLSTPFKVNSRSNRMGIRLDMEEPLSIPNRDMKSSGVIPGIIQLPPNGKPIILMQDGQTVGGYPRIGKVLDIYLGRVAQVPPGGIVRFMQSKK
tara:strand:- start:16998 stop:17876 length:879 start_codon:yes stop_codon:yes gene_type:complete